MLETEEFPLGLAPTKDPAWLVIVDDVEAAQEPAVESWLTVSNGRFAVRGLLPGSAGIPHPACFVAGFYGNADGDISSLELVPCPDVASIRVALEPPFPPAGGPARGCRRILDLAQGVLFTTQTLPGDRALTTVRFASMAERSLLAVAAQVHGDRPAALSAPVFVQADSVLRSAEVRRTEQVDVHLHGHAERQVHMAVATHAERDSLHRVAAFHRSYAPPEEADAARSALEHARGAGLARAAQHHRAAVADRWRDAAVEVAGAPEFQRALSFALFHLMCSGDPECETASIGARGLTGTGYRGHVFWDTDVFVVPFFTYTHPATARALLAYRYRTLDAARERAGEYRGALFPWEGADTGEDCTPAVIRLPDGTAVDVLTGQQEIHISADVAWAVWQYWQVTGDDGFMADMGTELLVETARFWASRATVGEDRRYHITGVIGPDEYHEEVTDNAFTNVMARQNLRWAAEAVAWMAKARPGGWESLAGRLRFESSELAGWEAVASGLASGLHTSGPEAGLYEEFAGYFALEDLRAEDFGRRPFAGERVLGTKRLRRSQIIKQADVVMLAHLLPGVVPVESARTNYRYYEPRTAHGSSLSPAIHAALAARTGDLASAMANLDLAARVDLDDRMGNASEGLHLAAMGGLWQAMVFGFGGVAPESGGLRLDPVLPEQWDRLRFALRFRGTRVAVEASARALTVDLDGDAAVATGSTPLARLAAGSYRAERTPGAGWSELRR
ncbi:MAG TPA: glycosyl hydrolase family 65 protein [Actinomycetota bacterium]|nr:glycosyl hydrolase family 65 protein [Actinomycetota bacterium]